MKIQSDFTFLELAALYASGLAILRDADLANAMDKESVKALRSGMEKLEHELVDNNGTPMPDRLSVKKEEKLF